MKKILLSALLSLSVISSALALDLRDARSKGLVKESASGYIEAASSMPEVQVLVKDVNAKRKAEYERISKENGQSVEVVGKLAAEQIKEKM